MIKECLSVAEAHGPDAGRGKRYKLTTILMTVFLAKLSGANTSTEIVEREIVAKAK